MATEKIGPVPKESRLVEAGLGLDPVSVCQRHAAVVEDAVLGWRAAADAIEDTKLREEMLAIARRREDFGAELSNVISGRSGEVSEHHTIQGTLMRWWIEARSTIGKPSQHAILRVCRAGSRTIRDEYDQALDTPLPEPIRQIIVRQSAEIISTADWLNTIENPDTLD